MTTRFTHHALAIVSEALIHDANSYVRKNVALDLAHVPGHRELEVPLEVAAQDDDIEVKWAATYAIRIRRQKRFPCFRHCPYGAGECTQSVRRYPRYHRTVKVADLQEKLESAGNSSDLCSLDGGLWGDRFCIERAGERQWWVYHSERGQRLDETDFTTEDEACEHLWALLTSGRMARYRTDYPIPTDPDESESRGPV